MREAGLLKKALSVLALLLMFAIMLVFGVCSGKHVVDTVTGPAEKDVIGIGATDFFLRVRKCPSLNAEIVAVLRPGQEVTVLAEENGFYRITAEVEGEAEGAVETVKGYARMQNIFLKKDAK